MTNPKRSPVKDYRRSGDEWFPPPLDRVIDDLKTFKGNLPAFLKHYAGGEERQAELLFALQVLLSENPQARARWELVEALGIAHTAKIAEYKLLELTKATVPVCPDCARAGATHANKASTLLLIVERLNPARWAKKTMKEREAEGKTNPYEEFLQ